MSEAIVIYESEVMKRVHSAFDFPFAVARLLQERGICCGIKGVHGQILDTEYRVELDPPYRIERSDPEAAWFVWQGPQNQNTILSQGADKTS